MATTGLTQSRACRLIGVLRTELHACPRGGRDRGELRDRMVELAALRHRIGYRRVNVRLRRDGTVAHHKRVLRMCQQARLQAKQSRRRQGVAVD